MSNGLVDIIMNFHSLALGFIENSVHFNFFSCVGILEECGTYLEKYIQYGTRCVAEVSLPITYS